MRSRRRGPMRPASLLVSLLLVAGADLGLAACVSLPDSGAVSTRSVAQDGQGETLVDYTPAGPAPGSRPASLADGFLRAMTATPLTTSVAREFLARGSRDTWVPERGTVVYGSRTVVPGPGGTLRLQLRDVVELDARGSWQGDPTRGRGRDYLLRLVREGRQWRISDPPDRLLVPRSHFDAQYQQYLLHFFDPSAEVLVPEPVWVPRGRQAPTLLVASLLRGPASGLAGIERTFLPEGTSLDGLSVPVSFDGTAEVPLSAQVLGAGEFQLRLVFAQLAWTLRQVTGVERVQVTVGGSTVELPGAGEQVDVDDFSSFDPTLVYASSALFGVRDQRVVTLDGDREERLSGPFGALALSPRSIAIDALGQHVAGVAVDGSTVLDGDRDGAPGREARVSDTRTVYRGNDVLRPAYDLHEQLWLVDRRDEGARLVIAQDGALRTIWAPGISGADVGAFVLSRDGSRLVAVVRGPGRDRVMVARVARDARGLVKAVATAEPLPVPGSPERIVDVAWRTAAELAVLAAPSASTSQVLFVRSDGSSSAGTPSAEAAPFEGRADRLVTAPSRGVPLLLGARDGRLYALSRTGRWTGTAVEPGLAAATFVG